LTGSEGDGSESTMTVRALRKFGEAVLVDYTWWRDIEARQKYLQMKTGDKYDDGLYRSFLAEWSRLQTAYRGYREEVCSQMLSFLSLSEFYYFFIRYWQCNRITHLTSKISIDPGYCNHISRISIMYVVSRVYPLCQPACHIIMVCCHF
jgi:hypothetical protein